MAWISRPSPPASYSCPCSLGPIPNTAYASLNHGPVLSCPPQIYILSPRPPLILGCQRSQDPDEAPAKAVEQTAFNDDLRNAGLPQPSNFPAEEIQAHIGKV
ncbi:hypothetical protein UA08_01914 [Talaromyces atroroseus]|uniref:Uncharacterized protein n=1 Tax=Talaromyces atroroseus TaxID=1441469 RepID=A0A1Q5QB04_TALAT|nr:hypothetical protein UA08_01914 [Talaromyces atroroseus]OKL63061.1 hypothetical protein UA08_01914 [Talaromyces atroroseus]